MKEKFSTNKLFVGGLPPKLPNEDVVDFFKSFGEVCCFLMWFLYYYANICLLLCGYFSVSLSC